MSITGGIKMFIAPSILNSKIGDLKGTIALLEKKDIKYLHIDIMDGCFVPDMAFGPSFIADIRILTDMLFDVHLMIDQPEKIVSRFADIGADIITFHIESTNHAMRVIQLIKEKNVKVGIAINPATSVELIKPILGFVDQVLVMTANPGTVGQHFIPETIEKLVQLNKLKEEKSYSYQLEVDGKIDDKTIKRCAQVGADIFVSGGFIFDSKNKEEQISKLQNSLNEWGLK